MALPERVHDLLERLRVVHGASRVCQVERFWKFTTSSMRSQLNNNKSRCSCPVTKEVARSPGEDRG